jgi:uncharacterized membrane protein (UPF0127 family)
MKRIIISGVPLRIEVATRPFDYFKGLSGRKILENIDGMLFRFPFKWKWRMSMRGMNFPLDFIWIREGIIVEITQNMVTGFVSPRGRIDAVIEIPSGHITDKISWHGRSIIIETDIGKGDRYGQYDNRSGTPKSLVLF